MRIFSVFFACKPIDTDCSAKYNRNHNVYDLNHDPSNEVCDYRNNHINPSRNIIGDTNEWKRMVLMYNVIDASHYLIWNVTISDKESDWTNEQSNNDNNSSNVDKTKPTVDILSYKKMTIINRINDNEQSVHNGN